MNWSDADLSIPATVRFDRVAESVPNAEAVIDQGRAWTYRELQSASNQIARALSKSRPASNRTELIGVYMSPGAHYFAAYLGVLKAGHICLPLDVLIPPQRLRTVLHSTRPGLVLVNNDTCEAFEEASEGQEILVVDGFSASANVATLPSIEIHQPAAVYLTSGSTGVPKGVVRDHQNLIHHAMVYSTAHKIGMGDRQSYLYSNQSGASMPDMLGALLNGAALLPWSVNEHSIRAFADWILENEVTLLHLPIGLYRLLLDTVSSDTRFASLRVVLVGGEAAFGEDIERGRQKTTDRCVFVHQLATTETNYITRFLMHSSTPVPAGVIPVGTPARDKQVRLLDEDGEEVPSGQIGQIVVTSAYLAQGYWRDPQLTAEKFKSVNAGGQARQYWTGDLGRWTDVGLRHVGRMDQQVRIRGHRVELAEVEAALVGWDPVRQAVVGTTSAGRDGPSLVAYLVPRSPHDTLSLDALRQHLAGSLPDHMIPEAIVVMNSLPLLPTGKVDRKSLPDPSNDRPELRTQYIAPRDAYEARLAKIWEQVLGVRPIGMRDEFFDLGGSSLNAMRLIAKVSNEFNEDLPQASLLQAPTIEQQAVLLRSGQPTRPKARLVGIQPEGTRAPFFCISPRVVDVLAYRTLALELGEQQPFFALYAVGFPPRPEGVSRVEHEARVFAQDILRAAPNGPLVLGGYSHGGIVALEAARQLRRAGRQVLMLVMLDVYGPEYRQMAGILPSAAYRPLQVIRSAQRSISEFVPWVHFHFRTIRRIRWRDRWLYLSGKARNHLRWWGLRLRRGARSVVMSLKRVGGERPRTVGKSFRNYEPSPYDGPVALFKASVQPLGIVRDEWMGWRGVLTGKVRMITVPGQHDSILFGPRISYLADELGGLLEGLDANSGRSTEPDPKKSESLRG